MLNTKIGTHTRFFLHQIVLLALVVAMQGCQQRSGVMIQPWAVTGWPLRGMEDSEAGPARFSQIFTPVINDAGEIMFSATSERNGVRTRRESGFFAGKQCDLRPVVYRGMMASGSASKDSEMIFHGLGTRTPLNESGHMAFVSSLNTKFTRRRAGDMWRLYRSAGDGLILLAKEMDKVVDSDTAPTADRIKSFVRLDINDTDQVAVLVSLQRREDDGREAQGLLLHCGLRLKKIAVAGDPLPVSPYGIDGAVFHRFERPRLNNRGDLLFEATYKLPGTSYFPREGLFRYVSRDQRLEVLCHDGMPIPGLTSETIDGINGPVSNDNGKVMVHLGIDGPEIDNTNENLIASIQDGRFQIIAREGQPAPGIVQGQTPATFWGLGYTAMNKHGESVFSATLRTNQPGVTIENRHCLYYEKNGEMRLLLRAGDPVPCIGGGDGSVVWKSFGSSYLLNKQGRIALRAQLSGPGTRSDREVGIFMLNTSGHTTLIAREGGVLDVDPCPETEDLRTIKSIGMMAELGGIGHASTALNAEGDLAFYAYFEDGSYGAFVARLPKP